MKKCCDEVKVVKEDECVTEAKNAFLSVAFLVRLAAHDSKIVKNSVLLQA